MSAREPEPPLRRHRPHRRDVAAGGEDVIALTDEQRDDMDRRDRLAIYIAVRNILLAGVIDSPERLLRTGFAEMNRYRANCGMPPLELPI